MAKDAKVGIANPALREKHAEAQKALAAAETDSERAVALNRVLRLQESDAQLQRDNAASTGRKLDILDRFTITGVRLQGTEDPGVGEVVTFTRQEADTVMDAIEKVLRSRR